MNRAEVDALVALLKRSTYSLNDERQRRGGRQ